jgi:integrase
MVDLWYIRDYTMMDRKSGNNLASTRVSKSDLRYWLSRVFKPKSVRGADVYEANFYFARFQYKGRRIAMSLGTANQTLAATRAKERYLFLIANGWQAFATKYQADERDQVHGEKRANITVGEYIVAAKTESHLALTTLSPYIRAFRRIVAQVMGIRGTKKRYDYRNGGNREWIAKIDAIRLSEVTPGRVAAWKKEFVARAGTDVIARRRATVSANSFVRQAKSLFSKSNILDKLKSVELPGTLPFDGITVEQRTDTKFYGAGVDPHQLFRDAVAELGPKRPEELKAFLLALVLGLRRREVDLLEWQSFDFTTGTLRVMPTKWYALKTSESAAVLPVEPEILALFRGWRAKARTAFVIESNREPKVVSFQRYRCEATFAYLLGWLRGKGVEGNKPFHALRKLYGSVLAEKHGIHAASSGLRHSNIRTTMEFYADRTVKVTPGFGAALSGADVVSFSPASQKRRRPKRRHAE